MCRHSFCHLFLEQHRYRSSRVRSSNGSFLPNLLFEVWTLATMYFYSRDSATFEGPLIFALFSPVGLVSLLYPAPNQLTRQLQQTYKTVKPESLTKWAFKKPSDLTFLLMSPAMTTNCVKCSWSFLDMLSPSDGRSMQLDTAN